MRRPPPPHLQGCAKADDRGRLSSEQSKSFPTCGIDRDRRKKVKSRRDKSKLGSSKQGRREICAAFRLTNRRTSSFLTLRSRSLSTIVGSLKRRGPLNCDISALQDVVPPRQPAASEHRDAPQEMMASVCVSACVRVCVCACALGLLDVAIESV